MVVRFGDVGPLESGRGVVWMWVGGVEIVFCGEGVESEAREGDLMWDGLRLKSP